MVSSFFRPASWHVGCGFRHLSMSIAAMSTCWTTMTYSVYNIYMFTSPSIRICTSVSVSISISVPFLGWPNSHRDSIEVPQAVGSPNYVWCLFFQLQILLTLKELDSHDSHDSHRSVHFFLFSFRFYFDEERCGECDHKPLVIAGVHGGPSCCCHHPCDDNLCRSPLCCTAALQKGRGNPGFSTGIVGARFADMHAAWEKHEILNTSLWTTDFRCGYTTTLQFGSLSRLLKTERNSEHDLH